MSVILFIRQGVLVTMLFSVIVLAISADLISQTQQYFGLTAIFCALGVAIASISLVTLPVMLVVDIMRRGAFTSMIVVEVAWLSILWILWVATAGQTVYTYEVTFTYGCNFVDAIYNGMCRETQVIEAFSFLNFVILLFYTGFLTVIAVIAASRGQNVWLSSVKESFGSPAGPVQHPMTHYNASAPPVSPNGIPVQPQYTAGPTHPGAAPSGPVITV